MRFRKLRGLFGPDPENKVTVNGLIGNLVAIMVGMILKSFQQLNAFVVFSLITSEIIQLTHRYKYQFVGEGMTDYVWRIKEIIQHATHGIPKGMKKCNFYFYCF